MRNGLSRKVSERELAIFCRQLGTLLASGLALPEALDVLATGTKQKGFKRDILQVSRAIKAGHAFSEAASLCKSSFPSLFAEMIGAAELAGGLTPVLYRLSDYYDRQADLHTQLLQVTLYPLIVLIMAVTVLIILMVKVVPVFMDMISSMSGEVPFMTRLLVVMGEVMAAGWPFFIFFLSAVAVLIRLLSKKPKYAAFFGSIALKLPLLGHYVSDSACMQLAQNLSILLQGGVNLPEALSVCAAASTNGAFGEAVKKIREEVILGHSLYGVMISKDVFPPELCQIVRVGEQSGTLKDAMDKAADYYLKSFTRRTKLLMTVLEPTVLVFVGIMVLLVLMAVMQPIYQIYDLYTGVM